MRVNVVFSGFNALPILELLTPSLPPKHNPNPATGRHPPPPNKVPTSSPRRPCPAQFDANG